MTAPHLWLHGDPTEGRRAPSAARAEEPAPAAAAPAPPTAAATPAPRSRRRRGLLAPALAGGAVSATLMTAGLFGLGVLDAGQASTAAPRTTVAPSVGGARPSGDVGSVYAAASPAVVSIRAGSGSGTGFVLGDEGTIVTNAHVVGDATEVQVRFEGRESAVTGRVLGTDRSTDLAAVRVQEGALAGVRPLELADSDGVRVGQLAVAIGSPFGLEQTATAGIVSGLEREIQAPDGFQIDRVIQTDAPINPGNSGGPLLDARGRVIGVNSQIAAAGGGGNVGIGFAVPANTVREVIPRLARGETIERAYLGVATAAAASGVQVQSVTAGGPAARAGLRTGDVVVGVDGERVRAPEDLTSAIARKRPGDEVELEVRAAGGARTVTVELGRRP